jgi:hypothetical protein
VVFSACPLCVVLKWNKYGTLLSIEGGSTMMKLSYTLRWEVQNLSDDGS